ncbi:MAG: 16S rRNA (adenine(1518)-N(6)/adenine(1519)-N(6))-dimethyltransferase RsmA [Tissierellia bacterium]|nr:16S rRNA (adenine(1518)-N(6)/adenine(1519)-N(6))-dimethyltransferase RsmA [Tissierellia bacterium]
MIKNKRLYSPNMVKEIIEDYDFRFSKSLGQNFLIDGNIVRGIVSGAGITSEDIVLEIGPGIGTLTEELALNAKQVLAIEVDETLRPILAETLSEFNNVEIIFQDVLKLDLEEEIRNRFGDASIKVVANLPYYITTPIITTLLQKDINIHSLTCMVQKEVARRMVAKENSKDYSSISVFLKYFGDGKIILDVPKSVFMPKPKIDSAVVNLEVVNRNLSVGIDQFEKVIRASFSMRRKTILNCISKGLSLEKDEVREILSDVSIEENSRAENISFDQYVLLTERIFR